MFRNNYIENFNHLYIFSTILPSFYRLSITYFYSKKKLSIVFPLTSIKPESLFITYNLYRHKYH